MAKKKQKLTAAELEKLVAIVEHCKKAESAIGNIEFQKAELINRLRTYKAALDETNKELTEKYGTIEIDVNTGEFKKLDENA